MKRFLSTWSCTALLVLALPFTVMAAQEMSAQELAEQLQQNGTEWVILDVRTPAEYADGHLKNASNADINEDFEEILVPLPVEDTYVVYCRTGSRSAKAVSTMEQKGFKHIVHMKDGIEGWKKAQLPLTTD